MTEQERNTAFKAKLAELVVIVKELHGLAKLCFPHETPISVPALVHPAIFTPKSRKYADISALIFDKGENENGKIL